MATEFPAALRRLWLVLKHHQCASLRPYLRTYSYCSCQFDHWSSDFQYDYHKSVASDISEFHQVVALLHSCCVYVAVISVWWWAVWWWSKWTLYLEPANFPRVVFQSFFAKSFAGVNPSGARVAFHVPSTCITFTIFEARKWEWWKGIELQQFQVVSSFVHFPGLASSALAQPQKHLQLF